MNSSKQKKTFKVIATALIIAAILAATLIPIIVQWGGAWYTKAAYETADVAIRSDRILHADSFNIDPAYREKLIESLRD